MGEKKKSNHLDRLSLNEAGESTEQNQLSPCMHLLQRLWVTEVSCGGSEARIPQNSAKSSQKGFRPQTHGSEAPVN